MADPISGAIGGLSAIAGGIIGNATSSGYRKEALGAQQAALQQWLDIHVPDPEQQKVILQRYEQTGQLDPKLEEAIRQSDSNLAKVVTDPRLKDAQLNALSSLENVAERGGRTLDQDAYLQKVTNDVNTADRGRRLAIQRGMSERGMGGASGLELAAQLGSARDATQQQSDASLKAARDAQLNALSAIEKGGTLAGDIRGKDYQQAKDLATARDDIANFNARMLAGVNQRNTDRGNDAAKTNLQRRQHVADSNVDLSNKEEIANKSLVQQQFENEATKARGVSSGYSGMADAYNQKADRTANMWANIGAGTGQVGAAVSQYAGKKTPGELQIDDPELDPKKLDDRDWNTYG